MSNILRVLTEVRQPLTFAVRGQSKLKKPSCGVKHPVDYGCHCRVHLLSMVYHRRVRDLTLLVAWHYLLHFNRRKRCALHGIDLNLRTSLSQETFCHFFVFALESGLKRRQTGKIGAIDCVA